MLLYRRLEIQYKEKVNAEMEIEEKQTWIVVGGTAILLKRFWLTIL